MTLEEKFNTVDDHYLCFDDIPEKDKPSLSRKLCAMLKIEKLIAPKCITFFAEHDELYFDAPPEDASLEDILYLARCGVMYDEDSCKVFT